MTLEKIIQEMRGLSVEERKVLIQEIVDTFTEPGTTRIKERIPGLHAGTTWVSDDFDVPLPDSLWLSVGSSANANQNCFTES